MKTVKTDRSFWMYVLLSLITCGIYSFFFLHAFIRDLNTVCEGDGKKTPGLLKLFLLGIITFGIYTLIWFYHVSNRMKARGVGYNIAFKQDGNTTLLWLLLGNLLFGLGSFVVLYYSIKNLNTLSVAYNATLTA